MRRRRQRGTSRFDYQRGQPIRNVFRFVGKCVGFVLELLTPV